MQSRPCLKTYDDLGDVRFKIATHSGYPEGQTSEWLESVGDIDSYLDLIGRGGWTPYSQAIDQVNAALTELGHEPDDSSNHQLYLFQMVHRATLIHGQILQTQHIRGYARA